jgi:hypothetical protein
VKHSNQKDNASFVVDVGFIVYAVEVVVQFWNDPVGRELSLFL